MISTLKCELIFSKGQSLAKAGKLNESIHVYDQALAIEPYNTHILLHKAISLSRQGQHEDAINVINVAINSKPDNSILYQYLGRIYYEFHEYNNAIKAFDRSLELSPENELTLCYKHLTLLVKDENIEESCSILKGHVNNTNSEFKAKLLVFCETFLFVNRERARSLEQCMLMRTTECSTKFRNVLCKLEYYLSVKSTDIKYIFKPQEKLAYGHYAKAHYNRLLGNIDVAISEYQMALTINHELQNVKMELFDMYLSKYDPHSAWSYFEQHDAHNEYMDNDKIPSLDLSIIFNLGRYYYQTGIYDKANDKFKYVSEHAPKDCTPYYYEGLCLIAENQTKLAYTKFKNCLQQINPRIAEIRLDEMIRLIS